MAKLQGAKIHSFYIGDHHMKALRVFQVSRGLNSEGAALRAILDVVGRTMDAPKPPVVRSS